MMILYRFSFMRRIAKKEKILLFTAIVVILAAALLIFSRWQSSSLTPNNGKDDNVLNSTEKVYTTNEPAPTSVPTQKFYATSTEIHSIDELYADSALKGTKFESKKFYCSQITPYLVKEKTPCEIFLYWDNLDILIVYDGKVVVVDQFMQGLGPHYMFYNTDEELPDIYPCDFDGDGNYELIMVLNNFVESPQEYVDKVRGTTIVHYDPDSIVLQILYEIPRAYNVYFKCLSNSNWEVHRNSTMSFGNIKYSSGRVEFVEKLSDCEEVDHDRSWSVSFDLDLDNDGTTDVYKLDHKGFETTLKDGNDKKLVAFSTGILTRGPSGLIDITAVDFENDGNKEICITYIDNVGQNEYMVLALVVSKENGKYRSYTRAISPGVTLLRPLEEEGYYDLQWGADQHIYLRIPDPSFFTPDAGSQMLIKPIYNLPRSVKIEVIDGTPVLVTDKSMFIPGYSGKLETVLTGYVTFSEGKFRSNNTFEIEAFLGKPASNDDIVIVR